ncbi:Protein trichome birefringence-like 38, partial [Bienertia sinuspersici]
MDTKFNLLFLPSLFLLLLSQQTIEAEKLYHQFGYNLSTSTESLLPTAINRKCNIFQGKWVFDSSYPKYDSNCPFIDSEFNCHRDLINITRNIDGSLMAVIYQGTPLTFSVQWTVFSEKMEREKDN